MAEQVEFELEVDSHPAGDLQVLSFECEERMSALYELDVTLVPKESVDVDPTALVGKPACLTIHLGDGSSRFLDGIVAKVRRWDEGKTPLDRRVRLTVVPSLWRLGRIFRSRIFQNKSVPQIVEQVLKDDGIAADRIDKKFSGTYRNREYCVQYRETDLDFVQRLLEDEGIFYYFRHEHGAHVLVLGDSRSADQAIENGDATIPFREKSGMVTEEHLDRLETRLEVLSGKVTLRDFDWKRPATNLTRAAEASGDDKALEFYEYPGGYDDPAVGPVRAKIRLEEIRAQVEHFYGATNCRRFQPGYTIKVSEHPLDALNVELLLLSVNHHGDQQHLVLGGSVAAADRREPYRCHFGGQPETVPFRPPRITQRPLALGAETATVVGPSGEEIYTDHFGRVKVQFHWDREGKNNERSSCFMRVAQMWAGPGWGALYLPRIGHEVVVEFQEGDPDRPFVTGSVYNGANPPPIKLPDDKTKSTLRSASSPGGGGSNELRFEDSAGNEELYVHAQKDLQVIVEHDRTEKIGANDTLSVQGSRSIAVTGNQTLQVGKNDTNSIAGSQTTQIGGSRTVTIATSQTETIGADQSISVGAGQSVTVAAAAAESIGGAKALTVGGAYAVTVGGVMNEIVGALKAEEVGGAKVEAVGGKKTETVAGGRTLSVGEDLAETVGGKRTLKVSKDLIVNIGGKIQQVAQKDWTFKAKDIVLLAQDSFTIKVGSATIEVSDGKVVVKGSTVEVKASGDLVLKGSTIAEN